MTQEEIIAGNKLIAVFMGAKLVTGNYYLIPKSVFPNGEDYLKGDEFEYHSSWDWIMPVVEKINRIDKNKIRVYMGTCNNLFVLKITDGKDVVYKRVVQFITFYNSQTH